MFERKEYNEGWIRQGSIRNSYIKIVQRTGGEVQKERRHEDLYKEGYETMEWNMGEVRMYRFKTIVLIYVRRLSWDV